LLHGNAPLSISLRFTVLFAVSEQVPADWKLDESNFKVTFMVVKSNGPKKTIQELLTKVGRGPMVAYVRPWTPDCGLTIQYCKSWVYFCLALKKWGLYKLVWKLSGASRLRFVRGTVDGWIYEGSASVHIPYLVGDFHRA
jgi:hypothetical protein